MFRAGVCGHDTEEGERGRVRFELWFSYGRRKLHWVIIEGEASSQPACVNLFSKVVEASSKRPGVHILAAHPALDHQPGHQALQRVQVQVGGRRVEAPQVGAGGERREAEAVVAVRDVQHLEQEGGEGRLGA
jgi:hypothetical protein